MQILFKENDFGKIEYRVPRASEVFKLIRLCNVPMLDKDKLVSMSSSDQMQIVENLIENMDDFIVSVNVIIEDEIITDFKSAKERYELAPLLAEIAGDLMSFMNPTPKKKKS
jgi:hypothetical protein